MLPENVNQTADLAIRYAPVAIPRLTLVALPPGALPTRDYDLFPTFDGPDGETRIGLRVCVSGP